MVEPSDGTSDVISGLAVVAAMVEVAPLLRHPQWEGQPPPSWGRGETLQNRHLTAATATAKSKMADAQPPLILGEKTRPIPWARSVSRQPPWEN